MLQQKQASWFNVNEKEIHFNVQVKLKLWNNYYFFIALENIFFKTVIFEYVKVFGHVIHQILQIFFEKYKTTPF